MSVDNDKKNIERLIDLDQLQKLNLGPNWSEGKVVVEKKSIGERGPKEKRFPRKRKMEGRHEQRFTRPARERETEQKVFLDIKFYPDDGPFNKLIKAIRTSCKTYELFEISQLILEKAERLVAVIKATKSSDTKLYCSIPDGMPFLQKDQALNHVFKNYLDQFFTIEEVEVEAPKGSFPIINKCGITGEILGPPNYHRYQQLAQQHYRNTLSNIPYEKFTARIESSKDPELLNAWLEKMKKARRYTAKDGGRGGEPKVFNTWEEARMYLLQTQENSLVKEVSSVRIAGRFFEGMPKGEIKRMIENHLQQQRTYPLETANNLRGRLRRLKFSIYKRGGKGISYVCAVKRKFRDGSQVFADTVQKLVEFLEQHSNTKINELAKNYLGIDLKAEHGGGVEGGGSGGMSETEKRTLNQLMLDLRWLITEGYVTEYGNGILSVQPIVEKQEKKALEEAETKEAQEEAVDTEAEPEVSVEESVDEGAEVTDMQEGSECEGLGLEEKNQNL